MSPNGKASHSSSLCGPYGRPIASYSPHHGDLIQMLPYGKMGFWNCVHSAYIHGPAAAAVPASTATPNTMASRHARTM